MNKLSASIVLFVWYDVENTSYLVNADATITRKNKNKTYVREYGDISTNSYNRLVKLVFDSDKVKEE